jgi:hypothetical protein
VKSVVLKVNEIMKAGVLNLKFATRILSLV